MSYVLSSIRENASEFPDRVFYFVPDCSGDDISLKEMSWSDLQVLSDKLSGYFVSKLKSDRPVVVIGHKDPMMPVIFLACVKSGRAYVPVDISYPAKRIEDIVDAVDPEIIVTTEELSCAMHGRTVMDRDTLRSVFASDVQPSDSSTWVKGDDVFYIIFTSGSTGTPKGVQITSDCLDNFVRWAETLCSFNPERGYHTFINHAPFSFDLSVFDLYLSLVTGGTLWAVPDYIQKDSALYYRYLSRSCADVWVSTPSSAVLALGSSGFDDTLLPDLRLFLFCGETLTNNTAASLRKAFRGASVINTYGPTESTVAVTGVEITDEILGKYYPLPIGKAKPGTEVLIMDENGRVLGEGEKGEIVIAGDTVSPGYWKNPEKTQEVFGYLKNGGQECRLYHTHDEGYYRNGWLFYCGRIDLQVKLHGFRIELGDIENNILRIQGVENAVVVPDKKDDRIVSLTAFIILREEPESVLKARKHIRESLKQRVPEYMVPKNYVFVDHFPVTANGKIDRRKLEGSRNVQG